MTLPDKLNCWIKYPLELLNREILNINRLFIAIDLANTLILGRMKQIYFLFNALQCFHKYD